MMLNSKLTRIACCFSFTVAIVGALRCSAQSEVVSVITRAHNDRNAKIESLRLEYSIERTAMIPMDLYCKATLNYELPVENCTVVVHKDGRTAMRRSSARRDLAKALAELKLNQVANPAVVPYQKLLPALQKVPTVLEESINVFDGKNLMKKLPYKVTTDGKERTSFIIEDIARLKSQFFSGIPTADWLIVFPCPLLPKDDIARRGNRIPDLFEMRKCEIAPEEVLINNHQCIKLVATDLDVLYLSPKLKFAVPASLKRKGLKVFGTSSLRLKVSAIGRKANGNDCIRSRCMVAIIEEWLNFRGQ